MVEPYNKALQRILSPCYNTLLQWGFAVPPFTKWSLFSHPLHLSSHDFWSDQNKNNNKTVCVWERVCVCVSVSVCVCVWSLNGNLTFLTHSWHYVRKPMTTSMMTGLVEKEYELTVTPRPQTVSEAISDAQAPAKPPEDCSLASDRFEWLAEEPGWITVSSH